MINDEEGDSFPLSISVGIANGDRVGIIFNEECIEIDPEDAVRFAHLILQVAHSINTAPKGVQ